MTLIRIVSHTLWLMANQNSRLSLGELMLVAAMATAMLRIARKELNLESVEASAASWTPSC